LKENDLNLKKNYCLGNEIMWYFAWILGVSLAAALAIINSMWLELGEDEDADY
jgi:cyd operon protein YbgT